MYARSWLWLVIYHRESFLINLSSALLYARDIRVELVRIQVMLHFAAPNFFQQHAARCRKQSPFIPFISASFHSRSLIPSAAAAHTFIPLVFSFFTSNFSSHHYYSIRRMTDKLPPNLLALFAPRPGLRYLPHNDHAAEDRKTSNIGGVAQYLDRLKEVDDYKPTESWLQRRDRLRIEKKEKQERLLTEGFGECETRLSADWPSLRS